MSTHAFFKLIKCYKRGVGHTLRSHPTVLVFINVNQLIRCLELLANLHLQMLYYVGGHGFLFKFGHLPLLVLNELLKTHVFRL